MLPPFRALVESTVREMRGFAKRNPPAVVSLSWGKQSMVMAHLAFTRVDPSILCVFFAEPGYNIIADFDATRDAFLTRWPINYEEVFNNLLSPRKGAALHRAWNEVGGTFLGLAAEESSARRRTCQLGWIRWKDGSRRCTPLGKWTWRDISAYHAAHDLPCLSTYRRFGFEARTSAGVSAGGNAERGRDLMSSGDLARYDQIIKPYQDQCSDHSK